MKDVALKEIIWEIEKQSGFVFAYNANDLTKAGKVDVEVKDKTIREALTMCLKGTGLTFVMEEDVIV
ncbi:MAG: STN domain-containing protein, partial [Butyricimonas faecihominis]